MISRLKNWFKDVKPEPTKIKSFALEGEVFDRAVFCIDDPNWDISVKIRRQFWRIVKKHHPETADCSCRVVVHGSQIYILCHDGELDMDRVFSEIVNGKREFYV